MRTRTFFSHYFVSFFAASAENFCFLDFTCLHWRLSSSSVLDHYIFINLSFYVGRFYFLPFFQEFCVFFRRNKEKKLWNENHCNKILTMKTSKTMGKMNEAGCFCLVLHRLISHADKCEKRSRSHRSRSHSMKAVETRGRDEPKTTNGRSEICRRE